MSDSNKTMRDQDPEKIKCLMGVLDEFKEFVADSIREGHADDFKDHLDFLVACMDVFIDYKSSGESE